MSEGRRRVASHGLYVTWHRCVVDGFDHAVTDEEFAKRGARPAGCRRAVCGHMLMMGSALAPPGPPCESCDTYLSTLARLRLTQEHQAERPSALRRLLRHFQSPAACGPRQSASVVSPERGGRTSPGRRGPLSEDARAYRHHVARWHPMTGRILLVRLRPGLVGESRRVVHIVPETEGKTHRVVHVVPEPEATTTPESLRAYCGGEFRPGELELLDGITGMPCERCLLHMPLPDSAHIEPGSDGRVVENGNSAFPDLAGMRRGLRNLGQASPCRSAARPGSQATADGHRTMPSPPLTAMICPLTKRASSLARNTMTGAKSRSASPSHPPSGTWE